MLLKYVLAIHRNDSLGRQAHEIAYVVWKICWGREKWHKSALNHIYTRIYRKIWKAKIIKYHICVICLSFCAQIVPGNEKREKKNETLHHTHTNASMWFSFRFFLVCVVSADDDFSSQKYVTSRYFIFSFFSDQKRRFIQYDIDG